MQLGFFTQPVHPPTRRYADVLREDQQAVVCADRLGFTEAFIGEHLTDRAETITSSLLFIAGLAERCPSITFGTGVLPLPNYHPVMAAAQVAMLDHMVQGRLRIGVGPGVPPDAEAIGDLGTDRAAKQAEALEQMIRLWTGEGPFDLEGRFYRTSTGHFWNPEIGVGSVVPTFQRPHPPIVLTSMRPDSSGPGLAGRRGWSGISAAYAGAHVVRAHLERYAAGRASAGVPCDSAGWRVARSIFVADDEATALRYAYDPDGPYAFYFRVMQTKLEKAGLHPDHVRPPG